MLPSHPFVFICVVWGDAFVERFLSICLPNFLSSNNLGQFNRESKDIFYLYTSEEGAAKIRVHPSFKQLERQLPTELRIFDDDIARDPKRPAYWSSWKLINTIFSQHIDESINKGAALCMLQPDSVWSDGSFGRFRTLVEQGKRVLMVLFCSVKPQEISEELLKRRAINSQEITINSRELVALTIKHLHEYSTCHDWNNPHFLNAGPGFLLWPVENEGLLGHFFCGANSVIVFPKNPPPWPITAGFELSDYIDQICSRDEVYVLNESDDVVAIGLESSVKGDHDYKLNDDLLKNRASPLLVANWIAQNARPLNIHIAHHVMRWRCTEPTVKWQEVDAQREQIFSMLIRLSEVLKAFPVISEDINERINGPEKRIAALSEERTTLIEYIECLSNGIPIKQEKRFGFNALKIEQILNSPDPIPSMSGIMQECIQLNPAASIPLITPIINRLAREGRVQEALDFGKLCTDYYSNK